MQNDKSTLLYPPTLYPLQVGQVQLGSHSRAPFLRRIAKGGFVDGSESDCFKVEVSYPQGGVDALEQLAAGQATAHSSHLLVGSGYVAPDRS